MFFYHLRTWDNQPSPRLGLVGLALSGGGIRSATFSLGVIQALAKHRALKAVDYLSTVSGGGYIGSCLSSVLNNPDARPEGEEFPLRSEVGQPEPEVVGHLRNSSKYLAPRGFLDKLRIPAIALRGIIINFLLALAILMALVFVIELIYEYGSGWGWPFGTLLLAGTGIFGLMVLAYPVLARLYRSRTSWAKRDRSEARFTWALFLALVLLVAVPVFLIVDQAIQSSWAEVRVALKAQLSRPFQAQDAWKWLLVLGVVVLLLLAARASRTVSKLGGRIVLAIVGLLGPAILAVIFLVLVVLEINPSERRLQAEPRDQNIVLLLDNSVLIGKLDRAFEERTRNLKLKFPRAVAMFLNDLESRSDIYGKDTKVAILWFDEGVGGSEAFINLDEEGKKTLLDSLGDPYSKTKNDSKNLNFRGQWSDSPKGMDEAIKLFKENMPADIGKSIIFISDGIVDLAGKTEDEKKAAANKAAAIRAAAIRAAAKNATAKKATANKATAEDLRTNIADDAAKEDIRIFGVQLFRDGKSDKDKASADSLFDALADKTRGAHFVLNEEGDLPAILNGLTKRFPVNDAITVDKTQNRWLAWWDKDVDPWFIPVLIGLWVYLFLVDVNLISLHRFYRDRLSKAYLVRPGESGVPEHTDTLKLSELNAEGTAAPYHLINAALNLQASPDPSLRGRNADFFVFSKRFTGAPRTGYRDTAKMEAADPNLDLGTAMAISGAAAAPNMGAITVRRLVFLMTLLNVRLGYWLRNPARPAGGRGYDWWIQCFRCAGPSLLFREALGRLNARGAYVNVSDGGHLENLGLYELLRRRCRLIIAVDGEADPHLRFEGLTKLMVYARIDLGIRIRLADLDAIRRVKDHVSDRNWTLGVIDYGDGEVGHLLYIKSSNSRDETEYVRGYRESHPGFPHESTADQFFDETQFEAYRSLGYTIADEVFSRTDELGDFAELTGHGEAAPAIAGVA